MINIAVIGAAGRMGRRIIANAVENGNFKVTGAVEWEGCPLLGQDAGCVAGVDALDVKITADLAEVVRLKIRLVEFAPCTAEHRSGSGLRSRKILLSDLGGIRPMADELPCASASQYHRPPDHR